MTQMGREVLRVSNLHAYYGESHILQGVGFVVRHGELITLLGRNGAGRTTTLKAILGMVGRRSGSIVVKGKETIAMQTYRVARLGLGYCPEERGIFANLSATENLLLPPSIGPGGMSLEEIYKMFPNLAERTTSSGTRLSGGEQQMLALARILRTGADILLLDEITEGLAPVIVNALETAIRTLKSKGYTIILVEQNFQFTCDIADRHYVIENGRVLHTVAHADLKAETPKLQRLLGL
ncbi:ABC transporter ATP-binding protein [Pseudorhodoplanes sp.]|uniref:ABC transporter ATP-binding protein n=1 Tax=Pseudorhodoplanes sp. TaxID=1934341 RepID=UPI003D0BC2A8